MTNEAHEARDRVHEMPGPALADPGPALDSMPALDADPARDGGSGGNNTPGTEGWLRLCGAARLTPERAVAALAPDGAQVAVGRLVSGELFAVGHHDPYALANVIARGVVGTRTIEGETFDVIQSPLFKQAFDVRTGEDVADRRVRLGTWRVRERDGVIELGPRTSEPAGPERTTR